MRCNFFYGGNRSIWQAKRQEREEFFVIYNSIKAALQGCREVKEKRFFYGGNWAIRQEAQRQERVLLDQKEEKAK